MWGLVFRLLLQLMYWLASFVGKTLPSGFGEAFENLEIIRNWGEGEGINGWGSPHQRS